MKKRDAKNAFQEIWTTRVDPADKFIVKATGPLAAVGFLVSVAAIVLACVPADDDPNKTLAVIKIVGASVVLFAAGAAIYFTGTRKRLS